MNAAELLFDDMEIPPGMFDLTDEEIEKLPILTLPEQESVGVGEPGSTRVSALLARSRSGAGFATAHRPSIRKSTLTRREGK